MKHTICAWCKNPTGATRITLTTDKGREEVCATCGRTELERRAREEKGERMSAEPESSLPDYLIIKQGMLNLQVCSRLSKDALLTAMKQAGDLESGTSLGWVLAERAGCEPVACGSYPTRTHYLFDC